MKKLDLLDFFNRCVKVKNCMISKQCRNISMTSSFQYNNQSREKFSKLKLLEVEWIMSITAKWWSTWALITRKKFLITIKSYLGLIITWELLNYKSVMLLKLDRTSFKIICYQVSSIFRPRFHCAKILLAKIFHKFIVRLQIFSCLTNKS